MTGEDVEESIWATWAYWGFLVPPPKGNRFFYANNAYNDMPKINGNPECQNLQILVLATFVLGKDVN